VRGILSTDRLWPAALVGAGNLGRALVTYRGFASRGFEIAAVFDRDPAVVGQRLGSTGNRVVLPMSELPPVVRARNLRIGIIAVPASAAQDVAEQMLNAGIRGLLNFAPAGLDVPVGVPVVSADPAIHLEQLAFQVAELAP
jgi:redox-sensing transcriptional repressor